MSDTPRATLILLAVHGSFRRATNGKRRVIGLMSTAGGCWEIGCTLRNSGKCWVSIRPALNRLMSNLTIIS